MYQFLTFFQKIYVACELINHKDNRLGNEHFLETDSQLFEYYEQIIDIFFYRLTMKNQPICAVFQKLFRP